MASASAELAELLRRTGQGDRAAFRALYDQSSGKLFGVLLRLLRDRAAASEVLQDAYLRIWQNAASFEPAAGQASTWMTAIARNAAIDLLRKRTEVPIAPDDDMLVQLEDGGGDLETGLATRDDLDRCLRELEHDQRESVVLAYCSGYSREELAQHFGRPVATVKTWLRRSLMALRMCLERS